jgi:predicted nucleic acid-binding protein
VSSPTVLLDACVLINLLASEEIDSILRIAGQEFKICDAVEKESLYLRPDDPQELSPNAVQLDPLIMSGVLSVCVMESDTEETLYVEYAGQLDDGEAMSIAIAEARSYRLATDDRKARRIFLASTNAPERLISTSDLVRSWAERESISPDKLNFILLNIQHRANFIPPKSDANLQWWQDSCGSHP